LVNVADDAFGDTRFSNGCFNLGPGEHSIHFDLLESYFPEYSQGSGALKVVEGYCPGTEPVSAPEFPSAALPAAMIIGLLGAVLFVRRTGEE
jgi:hypothetical protein